MATICEIYHPFDSGTGSNVLEDRWRDMARFWLRSGPIQGELNGFQVYADSTGMQVKVKTGKAWIVGHYASNAAEKTLAIAAYVSARFDLVILRADFANNRVELDVLTGAGGASIPALTQNTAMWEIALGLVTVDSGSTIAAGKITDWRQYAAGVGAVGKVATYAVTPSATGLGTPVDGDFSYELDTNRWRGYEGAVWRWVGGKIVGWQGNRGTGLTVVSGNWTRPALNDVYDVDAIHAGTDSFITIAETGTYRVTGIVNFGANVTGGRGVGVNIGSAAHTGTGAPTDVLSLIPAPSTNGTFVNGCDEFDLTAGQIVTFVVMSNGTGVGLDVLSAKFTCTLIGYRT